ncbi:hypothetical protein OHA72_33195 [Dactylosporangium sp. NBC_01737]|uniref:hypothetical protein n=1 Tax=Dactylosporangium sp. NBC_01737 TaxID=2975959 RepID=UPI002E144D98|nr:hypothetical protein OHA72_33195 [Dactylosporangium sp. NBC_01737]
MAASDGTAGTARASKPSTSQNRPVIGVRHSGHTAGRPAGRAGDGDDGPAPVPGDDADDADEACGVPSRCPAGAGVMAAPQTSQ